MPIPVLCPGCSVKLNAPDAAAGKNVKCPKCGTLMTIPKPTASAFDDFEPVDDPAPKQPAAKPPVKAAAGPGSAAVSKKPAVKTDVVLDDDDDRPRRRRRDDDDDDDDDDDRPKKKGKKGKKKAAAGPPVALIGGIVAGVLLIGGGGFAAYWFGFRDKSKETTAGTNSPGGDNPGGGAGSIEGWVEFSPVNGGFKVQMPRRPGLADQPAPRAPNGNQPKQMMYKAGGEDSDTVSCEITVVAFPPAMSAADKDKYLARAFDEETKFVKEFMKELSRGEATVAGKKATEVVIELDLASMMAAFEAKGKGGKPNDAEKLPSKIIGTIRWFVHEDRGYVLVFGAKDTRQADKEKAFFASFQLTEETTGSDANNPNSVQPVPIPEGKGRLPPRMKKS